ncbi:hypothetical protein [Streptomyces sp. NPDC055189]
MPNRTVNVMVASKVSSHAGIPRGSSLVPMAKAVIPAMNAVVQAAQSRWRGAS